MDEPNQRPLLARERPLVLAGPCVAESYELLESLVAPLVKLSTELNFDLVFKASFDKANRTSIDSYRGPGLATGLKWFGDIKTKYKVPILTDIHEQCQIDQVAAVCDWLQIPAFLCRQTDLLVKAVETGRPVNVKKGQYLAPETTSHIVQKARTAAKRAGKPLAVALTERGTMFGYGNYVVDMRGLAIMAKNGVPVLFDVTHSVQRMSAGGTSGEVTGGQREFAPLLARSAIATGYLSGLFLEVHTNPASAKSDRDVTLSLEQAKMLLAQSLPLWKQCRTISTIDREFAD